MTFRDNNFRALLRDIGIALACLWLWVGVASAQSAKPVMLECESLITPLGMDAKEPLLSWKLQDTNTGAQQTSYEIQVASSSALLAAGTPDIWDSRRVESRDSIGAGYRGPALTPSKRYFWRVLVWGRETGRPSGSATKNPNVSTFGSQVRSGLQIPILRRRRLEIRLRMISDSSSRWRRQCDAHPCT